MHSLSYSDSHDGLALHLCQLKQNKKQEYFQAPALSILQCHQGCPGLKSLSVETKPKTRILTSACIHYLIVTATMARLYIFHS
jgi:hypothetical protein